MAGLKVVPEQFCGQNSLESGWNVPAGWSWSDLTQGLDPRRVMEPRPYPGDTPKSTKPF